MNLKRLSQITDDTVDPRLEELKETLETEFAELEAVDVRMIVEENNNYIIVDVDGLMDDGTAYKTVSSYFHKLDKTIFEWDVDNQHDSEYFSVNYK